MTARETTAAARQRYRDASEHYAAARRRTDASARDIAAMLVIDPSAPVTTELRIHQQLLEAESVARMREDAAYADYRATRRPPSADASRNDSRNGR